MQNWLRLTSKIFGTLGFFLLTFNLVFAVDTLSNTGLIKNNIWFSKDPFYSGDRVRIYSVIGNGSDKDIRGDVNFYDGDSLICNTNFLILAGRITEAWCDWGVAPGEHGINVKIFRVKSSSPGMPEVDVELSNTVLATSQRFVEPNPTIRVPAPSLGVQSDQANSGQDGAVAMNSPQDNIITSAISNIKNAIFGTDKQNSPPQTQAPAPKGSKPVAFKDSQTKKQIALSNVQKIKKEIGQVVSSNPVLRNTASIYSSLGENILNPMNGWLDGLYESMTKSMTNKPLLYLLVFLRFIFKYIIFTPYFLTVVLFYLFYRILRTFYRKYRER